MFTHPYQNDGYAIPELLLPSKDIDLTKWAVIACDQFTSEPGYWQSVESIVGHSPSTYHLMLPEAYLDTPREAHHQQQTQIAMQSYLDKKILEKHNGMVYVQRTFHGHTRQGIMLCLDLEAYDFSVGSQSLIRATEATVAERLPPRIRIREKALLELPHILVLIDDPDQTVIEPIAHNKSSLRPLYNIDLMLESGQLQGYAIDSPEMCSSMHCALQALSNPARFQKFYNTGSDKGVLLFAVGDGNHSLATAKSIWEKLKPTVGMDHPARYALVEIENVHDHGLIFEPIHRVLFDVKHELLPFLKDQTNQTIDVHSCKSTDEMILMVQNHRGPGQAFGLITPATSYIVTFSRPTATLTVGTLQPLLDRFIQEQGATKIDYVHGTEIVSRLGSDAGNTGIFLPVIDKGDLFKTVIHDGVLPRKTFSMGEAREKRFYMECRSIVA